MVSSDDVASLKVEVQKLAAALDRFAQKLAAKGNVHGSKLPSISQESNTIIGARKVFVKIPEPNTFSNPGIQTPIGTKSIIPCDKDADLSLVTPLATLKVSQEATIHGEDGYANGLVPKAQSESARKVLDQLPIPTFILEMAQAAKETELGSTGGDYEPGLDTVCDNHNIPPTHSDVVEPSVGYILEEDVRNPATHNLFDEMPQPGATLQIPQTEHIVHDEPGSDEPNVNWDESLEYKRRVLDRLGALDNSHFRDLIIIHANRVRFSKLSALFFVNRHFYDQITHDSDEFDNRNLHCERLFSEVSFKSIIMFYTFHSTNLVENVVFPLLLSDMDWFMSSSLSKILGVNVYKPKELGVEYDLRSVSNIKELYSWDKHSFHCDHGMSRLINGIRVVVFQHSVDLCRTWVSWPYDPGILGSDTSTLVCPYTLEDKGDFRGEEDTSRAYTWKLSNPLTLYAHFNASRIKKNHLFLTYIFDPGDSYLACDMLDGNLTRYLPDCLLFRDVNFAFQWTSFPFSPCSKLASLILALIPCRIIEAKSHFEVMRNDMGLALWCRMSSLICCRNHLATNGSMLKAMTCSSVCFDPGGLHYIFCVIILIGLMRVVTRIDTTSVWIFNPGGIGNLFGSTSIVSTLYPVYGVAISSDVIMYLMFFSHHENGLFQGGVVGYVCYFVHHGLVSIISKEMSKSLISHFIVEQMKQFSAKGHYLVSTYCNSPTDYTNMILGYGIKNQNVITLIFDPGGFKSWLRMRNRPDAYLFTGCKRLKHTTNEDYQVYVFDPGGPFRRLVKYAAMPCFNCDLSLILEDKDRFKRRVLIHTKNETKGSLVIYLFCFLFSKLLSYILALANV